jgi:predicted transcriptional regulator
MLVNKEALNSVRENRRSKVEIMIDILKCANKPIRPTRLMYASNISWKVLQWYLSTLIQEQYLEEIMLKKWNNLSADRYAFVITPKGQAFVDAFKTLNSKFISSVIPKNNDTA